jgi:hypothetical protein
MFLILWLVQYFFSTLIFTLFQLNCSCHADDDEEAQDGEGPRHWHRGRVLQERRDSEEEPRPGGDEPQVRDDPRAVVTGQHHVLRQPGHALLVPLKQARPVTA